MAEEIIYVGQVVGKDRYAIWHNAPSYQSSEFNSHFNFDMSFDEIAAYIEGATAHHFDRVGINNGIPSRIRGKTYESIRTEKLSKDSLDKLLEDSGLKLGGKYQGMDINEE